ncbi:MAG TPA: PAS domain S-box protein [Candidatus Saccharimonadia bacterium]|nr:PAS domain S-box protein [Candidatus Saccharimonadia bacterium]
MHEADCCQRLMEAIKDYAVVVLDEQGRIAGWNQGAQRLSGWTPEQALGRHLSLLCTREDIVGLRPHRLLEQAQAEGRAEHEGWYVRDGGATFWGHAAVTALGSNGPAGFVMVVRDLTADRQAEQNIRTAYGELEQVVEDLSERNRELHRLTTNMAGREYRIRELESQVKLLRLRLDLAPPLKSSL